RTRFQSEQIGLEIPLMYQHNQARLKSSKIAETIAKNEYQFGKLNLEIEYKKAIDQYKKKLEIVQYYERTVNKNAKTIAEIAQLQFYNGEINYLDLVTLINQSTAIQNNYLDAIRDLNQSISTIYSITFKP
ncbi:MAG: TolC family protein, partial [Chitinophagales bacterium]|nr:TolC family protein [Chitinophagales bacterium]